MKFTKKEIKHGWSFYWLILVATFVTLAFKENKIYGLILFGLLTLIGLGLNYMINNSD